MHPLLGTSARLVVGHRGNCAHAPENTLASFAQAVALGVDAIEFDVRLDADGTVVVMHDPTVERTTDGTGAVASLPWDALRRLDAGHRFTRDGGASFPYRGSGVGVPRAIDVLRALPATPVLIEVKVPEAAAPLRAVIEEAGAGERCLVESFHDEVAAAFAGSTIATGASQRDVVRLLWRALLRRPASRLPFRFMAVPPRHGLLPVPIAGLVAATRAARAPVHVWTVNDAAHARRLWQAGACAIISDDPAVIIAARAAAGTSHGG
ncbi:MAG: glycerophosphodiester phosphodiesterase [Gemmatimonadetes bacterium]|nr:glycerophosphodiester phosphodiesterase [Gemmatimonadota bacterium]